MKVNAPASHIFSPIRQGTLTLLILCLLVVSALAQPVISTQPVGATRCVGASVTFSVVATGTDPLSYAWVHGATPVGANSATLTIPAVALTDAGDYSVTVTDAAGSTPSAVATLVVNPLPTASVNSGTICMGGAMVLTATSSAANPTYLWSPGGATTVSVTVNPTATTIYTCTVTDGTTGCSVPASGTVNVTALPTVAVNSEIICSGGSATLTATSDAATPSYVWSPGGETTVSIIVSPAATTTYTVTVTDAGTTCSKSGSGTVTVRVPISATMANVLACPAGSATFSPVVSGTGPLTYVWKNPAGATVGTDSTLTINNAGAGEVGTYTVEVTGPCNVVTASAQLGLHVGPAITAQPVSMTKIQGDVATFSVTASSTAPLSYQWYHNGLLIEGATSSSYSINGANAGDIGEYYVAVGNCAGSVTSGTASLNVTLSTGIYMDFETVGQFTNNFNQTRDPGNYAIRTELQVWGEFANVGVNSSRALDGVRATGDDNTFSYYRTPFNFSRPGAVLRVSTMFKAKTGAATGAYQLGFLAHTNKINPAAVLTSQSSSNTCFNNNPGIIFMSSRLNRSTANTMTHDLEMQHRVNASGTATINASKPSGLTLVAGNWYLLSGYFTNNKTAGNQITFELGLQDMGTTGTTPGTVLATYRNNFVNVDLVNLSEVYPGMRCNEANTADVVDNFSAWMTQGPITITYPPQSQTLTSSRPVTFSGAVDGTPPYAFQWMKDGIDIPGATQPTYTIASPVAADAGAYTLHVYSPNDPTGNTAWSDPATLDFADSTAPSIVSVGSLNGKRIGVRFNEKVDAVSAVVPGNYTIAGTTVTSVTMRPDGESVELFLDTAISGAFTVTVSGVKDLLENAAAGASASSTVMGFEAYDVNGGNAMPLTPGYTYTSKAGDFDVVAGGADLWGSSDDGHLIVGPPRTGDFDVKVRVQSIGRYHYWDSAGNGRDDIAKAGLIVRESTNANSAGIQAVATPTELGIPMGRNYWEVSYRPAGGSHTAFGINNNSFNANFMNSPAYPNAWVRFRRMGNWFDMSISSNNVDWVTRAAHNVALNNTLYLSLGATAHYDVAGYPITAEFRDLSDVSYPGAVVNGVVVTPAQTNAPAFATVTFRATPNVTGASPSDFLYAWQRADGLGGFTNIPNLAPYNNTYTPPQIVPDDTNNLSIWKFRCIAYLSGQAPVTSTVGEVTGIYDTAGPTIASCTYFQSGNAISVAFAETVNPTTAGDFANWSLMNAGNAVIPLTKVEYLGESRANTVVVLYPSMVLTNLAGYKVVAKNMMDRWTPPNGPTTSTNTFTVAGQITYPAPAGGLVFIERYTGIGSATAPNGLTNQAKFINGPPDAMWYTNNFSYNGTFASSADTFGARLSAYFIPPTNGFYRLYMRNDDGAYFNMNTNELCSEEPIAKPVGYSDGSAGNYSLNGSRNPQMLWLVGGKRYYVEAGFKENTGGDGISLTYRSQNDYGTPANTEVMPAAVLAAHPIMTGAVAVASVTPASVSLTEGQYATFAASNIVGARLMSVAWFKGGVWQPGFDEAAARLGPFKLTDTSVTFLVSNLFSRAMITVPVTITPDTTAPTVTSARGDGTLFRVYVQFSEDVDAATATVPGNFSIPGLTVFSAKLVTPDLVVLYTSPQAEGTAYTVTVNGVKDVAAAGNTANGVTANFQSWIVGMGSAWREYYTNGVHALSVTSPDPRTPIAQWPSSINSLTNSTGFITHQPNLVDVNTLFESARFPINGGQSNFYGGVVSGFFMPPLSGNYTFLMQHDDGGEFLLYTDTPSASSPAGASIGMLNDYTVRGAYADSNNGSLTNYLEAGKRYYMEGRFKQGTGGNYIRVGVRMANGSSSAPIASALIAAAGDPNNSVIPLVGIAQQPIDSPETIENQYANFFLTATNSKSWPMGYQWQKFDNGSSQWVDVVGAASANVNILVTLADDGAQFRAKVGVPGSAVYSDPVSVHVVPDTTCPTIASANGDVAGNVVVVTFSEKVNPAIANNASKYTFSGGLPVLSATLLSDGKSVALLLGDNVPSGSYTVTVQDITDIAATPNTLCPNPATSGSFTAPWPLAESYVQMQFWFNLMPATGTNYWLYNVENRMAATTPDKTIYTNVAMWPQTLPDTTYNNYGMRMNGIIIPPVSGTYYFRSVADDSVRMSISPYSSMASAKTIINADGVGCAGCGMTSLLNISQGIDLVGGKPYSFEAIMLEGTGGDYMTNLWLVPGKGWDYIYSTNLAFTVNPDSVTLVTTANPASETLLEGRRATLIAGASASSGIPSYQWQQAAPGSGIWGDVVGATGTSYTTPYLCEADSGVQYRCVIGLSLVNGLITRTNITSVATVTVLPDAEPPTIVSVGSLDGNSIGVVFSEPIRMDAAGFQAFDNWEVLNAQILANIYYTNADGSCVQDEFGACVPTYYNYPVAQVLAYPDTNAIYTDKIVLVLNTNASVNPFVPLVGAFNVHCYYAVDTACVQNNIDSMADGEAVGLKMVDIWNPAPAGTYFSGASGRVSVTAGGYDIWGNGDQFTFLYKEVSGDFDARVTVLGIPDPAGAVPNAWSKAGLLARGYIEGTDGVVTNSSLGTATNSYMVYNMATSTNVGAQHTFASGVRYANLGGAADMPVPPGGINRPYIWSFPAQVRLIREGDVFTTMSYIYVTNVVTDPDTLISTTNLVEQWVTNNVARTTNWNSLLYVGLATTSHAQSNGVSASYENFKLIDRPVVTLNPISLVVTSDQAAVFTVAGSGPAEGNPLRYQWFKDGVAIVGATSATLTLNPPLLAADKGNYAAEVRNTAGSAMSGIAALDIKVVPTILTQPSSPAITCFEGTTLTLAVTGDEPITYQWRLNGVDLPGETAPTLAVPFVTGENYGPYSVVLQNAYGTTISADAYVTLVDPAGEVPPVISMPAGYSINAQCGVPVTYSFAASNSCLYPVPVVCTPPSGSVFPVGATTVNCTATDPVSGTGTASFVVNAVDTVAPVIVCPADITVEATGSTAVVSWAAVTAADACAGSVPVVCVPASGSEFAAGTNTVVCTAADPANNAANCSFKVIVNAPVSAISLAVQLSGGNITVSWSKPAVGYQLQSTPTLGPTANWQNYTGTITDTGSGYSVSVPATGNQFFRLHKP